MKTPPGFTLQPGTAGSIWLTHTCGAQQGYVPGRRLTLAALLRWARTHVCWP